KPAFRRRQAGPGLMIINIHFPSMPRGETRSSPEACKTSGIIGLPAPSLLNSLSRMEKSVPEQMTAPQTTTPARPAKVKAIAVKIVSLSALALALGLAQNWATARHYKPDRVAGFYTGILQGMLMPAALPGLLLGKDLTIYATHNSGRAYNIGYILGVNACGTLFFGLAFWQPRPRRRDDGPSASD
ncbi:MAG: hypothetical protein KGR98_10595, partial [Verrucomicrobia bacterium]|nr:hypothetical protein [Verrucomicrobiota bacterium]